MLELLGPATFTQSREAVHVTDTLAPAYPRIHTTTRSCRRLHMTRNLLLVIAVGAALVQSACSWPTAAAAPAPRQTRDGTLERIRRQLVGHDVYGFGGIALACPPKWSHVYVSAVPLHVVAVERERIGLELATGAQFGMDAYGPSFYEPHPLRIIFAEPRIAPRGVNYQVGGLAGRCPALDLAAFQIPLAFSLHAPPKGASQRGVRVGMTRDEVVWRIGYPWELGDQRKLLAESDWRYGVALGSYVITFRNNRVSSNSSRASR
jgi:hypothetical protein